MAVKDHGFWTRYIPLVITANVPRGAIFLRRDSDGMDWYEYVHDPVDDFGKPKKDEHDNEIKNTNFEKTTVKAVVDVKGRDNTEQPIVRAAAVEVDRLFPDGGQLLELLDEKRDQNEPALIIEFCNRHIDMKTGKVGDVWQPPPPPENPVMVALKEIMARLDKLEKR
jgi:hypothetical protein